MFICAMVVDGVYYTRHDFIKLCENSDMILMDTCFAMSDEFDDDEGMPLLLKIIIFIIILVGIAAGAYYLYIHYFQ